MFEIKVTLSVEDKLYDILDNLLEALNVFTKATVLYKGDRPVKELTKAEMPKEKELEVETKLISEPVAEQVTEEKSEEVTATIEEVRQALTDLRKKYGVDKVKQLLNDCGANKVSELKPEQYAAVIQVVKGAL